MRTLGRITASAALAAAFATPSFAGFDSALYTISLTNPTGIDWAGVLFEVVPDPQVLADDDGTYAAAFDLVNFPQVEGINGQMITGKTAAIIFDDVEFDNGEQEVFFLFPQTDPLDFSDGFVSFQVAIETPDLDTVPFVIQWRPVFVPSPGSVAIAGIGLLTVARRRRS